MQCKICNVAHAQHELVNDTCLKCTASLYETLYTQVKDLADTIDQGLSVTNSDKAPISRLSSQVIALLQCYIQLRARGTITDEIKS